MERAVKLGFGIFVRGKIQPSIALGLPREVVRALTEKACRERVNRENALANCQVLAEAHKNNPQEQEFNALVNSMPSWLRHRWAREGYKGLAHKDVEVLKKFLTPTQ